MVLSHVFSDTASEHAIILGVHRTRGPTEKNWSIQNNYQVDINILQTTNFVKKYITWYSKPLHRRFSTCTPIVKNITFNIYMASLCNLPYWNAQDQKHERARGKKNILNFCDFILQIKWCICQFELWKKNAARSRPLSLCQPCTQSCDGQC